jgi:hypothetical protein
LANRSPYVPWVPTCGRGGSLRNIAWCTACSTSGSTSCKRATTTEPGQAALRKESFSYVSRGVRSKAVPKAFPPILGPHLGCRTVCTRDDQRGGWGRLRLAATRMLVQDHDDRRPAEDDKQSKDDARADPDLHAASIGRWAGSWMASRSAAVCTPVLKRCASRTSWVSPMCSVCTYIQPGQVVRVRFGQLHGVRWGEAAHAWGMESLQTTRTAQDAGSHDGSGAGDHDRPYTFGCRPRESTPYPFSTRQYARLLVLRSRIDADLVGRDDRCAA